MRTSLIAFVLSMLCSTASAQVWTHENSVGETASQITSCNAGIVFADGGIIVRIYGDEMDIFFYHVSLSLPPSTELGSVALSFKADTFVATAFSSSSDDTYTSSMLLGLEKSDYEPLFNALRYGSVMKVVFPDGTFWDIQLDQSTEALDAAGACWQAKPTGPAGINPFQGATGNNPFN